MSLLLTSKSCLFTFVFQYNKGASIYHICEMDRSSGEQDEQTVAHTYTVVLSRRKQGSTQTYPPKGDLLAPNLTRS
jgi:hypothetical protein